MINLKDDLKKVISTLKNVLYNAEEFETFDIINSSLASVKYDFTSEEDVDLYVLLLEIDIDAYLKEYEDTNLREVEDNVLGYMFDILRGEIQQVSRVVIKPLIKNYINWSDISELYDRESLISDIEKLKKILIDVSTGEDIKKLNEEYIVTYNMVDKALKELDIDNPNVYKDLWEAYNYWSQKLETYAERRTYFSNIFDDMLKVLCENNNSNLSLHLSYTGWKKLDRIIAEIKKQFKEAVNEEQFNAIGAMCRSAYIVLTDEIYDEKLHKTLDGVIPSKTDYKRKLEAFINYKLSGKTNEMFRSHCKKTTDLADELTHKITANKMQTALTITALISVVTIVEILNGNNIKL